VDINQFSSVSPGKLVPIEGNDHAFIPLPLPPSWEFPNRLWPLLSDAKHKVGLLEGIGRYLPNPDILLVPAEKREALTSSRLEGTHLTVREMLLFDIDPQQSSRRDDSPGENWREINTYRRAMRAGIASPLPLSLRLLRDMHAVLMEDVRGQDRAPGQFRQIQVQIGRPSRFVPPPPRVLQDCLSSLEKHLHVNKSTFDPLVDCFLAHYQFETIHPFVDGNGRVGRLLLALMLLKKCGLSRPWLYMSAYFEAHREEYVERLFNVSARNDWEGWVEFCLKATIHQAEDTFQRCERLLMLEATFKQKVEKAGGSVRLNRIIDHLFNSPFINVTEMAKYLDVSYPTAKTDIERLVQVKVLRELPDFSPKTYYARGIFEIGYEDLSRGDE